MGKRSAVIFERFDCVVRASKPDVCESMLLSDVVFKPALGLFKFGVEY